MKRVSDLENRLTEWGKEYGGSRYEYDSGGGSPLGSMIKWGGRTPTGMGYEPTNTAADEVHAAVKVLADQVGGWLPAEILRCEYWLPGQPIDSKLQKLRKIGDHVSRAGYYTHLRVARVHVAAWLRISFSPDLSAGPLAYLEACV